MNTTLKKLSSYKATNTCYLTVSLALSDQHHPQSSRCQEVLQRHPKGTAGEGVTFLTTRVLWGCWQIQFLASIGLRASVPHCYWLGTFFNCLSRGPLHRDSLRRSLALLVSVKEWESDQEGSRSLLEANIRINIQIFAMFCLLQANH